MTRFSYIIDASRIKSPYSVCASEGVGTFPATSAGKLVGGRRKLRGSAPLANLFRLFWALLIRRTYMDSAIM